MVLNVNGVKREVNVDPDVALLTVLRDHLDLTGSKYGCGEGDCGACTVLINDNPTQPWFVSVIKRMPRCVSPRTGIYKSK